MAHTIKVRIRELTPEVRRQFDRFAHSRTAQARLVERARIRLAAAEGRGATAIARDLSVFRATVYT
jgi:hypothetical protein